MNKILIVDDSRTVEARLSNTIKEKIGYQIIQAPNKKICMDRLIEHDGFEIAFLDINLPDAPNGEIIEAVAKYNIPIVVLTGSEEINQEILDSKYVIDYIIKDRAYAIEQAALVAKRYINNKNHTVLIVDDSKTFANKLDYICKRYNLNTIVVDSGENALKKLKELPEIDLIFTDYMMPEMDGIDLIIEVRKKYSEDDLSIIAISGTNEKDVVPKLLKYGANDFIFKDFSEEELIARLNAQLNILELFKETKDKANKDYLTGMYNRRYMFEKGNQMLEYAKDKNEEFALAILDIDKFKNINDTYGHDIGDVALKEIAKVLDMFIQKDTLCARMGGEEFCIIFANKNEEEAFEILEKVRLFIQANNISIDEINLSYTISIGMYSDMRNKKTLDEFIKAADEALYEAKETGRNQTIIK